MNLLSAPALIGYKQVGSDWLIVSDWQLGWEGVVPRVVGWIEFDWPIVTWEIVILNVWFSISF